MMMRSLGRRLILAAASTVTTFTLAAGRVTHATLVAGAAHWAYHGLGAYRGVRLKFWATADNKTATVRLWGVTIGRDSAGKPVDAELEFIGSIAVTSGNTNGVSGGLASATDYLADTLVFTKSAEGSGTPRGPYTDEETAAGLGTQNDFSYASDKPGSVRIMHLGDYDGIVIECCIGDGAGAGSNPAASINGDLQLTA